MERWYKEYREKAKFYVIYIREAHPADSNRPVPGAPNDPTTLLEREVVASKCIKAMRLSIPFLVDDMKDTANRAYAAWPDRIYIVGRDGKIAFKAGRGPWGFKPAQAERSLKEHLAKGASNP